MNKAERMIIGEKFEDVILALPVQEYTDKKPAYVLTKTIDDFRKVLKAL